MKKQDCAIVISSSWRFHHDLVSLKNHFSEQVRDQIMGVTGEAYIGAHARFHEINAYATHHGIDDWRALDDSYWEFPQGCSNLIRCNPNSGLAQREVNLLSSWLGSTL